MPKVKISEFDIDPANNTDINNINIAEGCAPSGINNAIRQLMSDLKEFQTGAGGDSITAVGVFSDTVGEKTSAAGVTVDGVLLKDSGITASGTNVLSGTTIPSSKTLVVTTDIGTSVQAYDADTTKNDVANTFSANQIISVTDNSNAALRITQLGTGNALLVEDSTNPDASPFVINSSGFVLSGLTTAQSINLSGTTVTPANQLFGNSANTSAQSLHRAQSSSAGPNLILNKSRGSTEGDVTIVQNGDTLGSLVFQGADGATSITGARIIGEVDGTPSTNDMPGRLIFSTTADGASSPTERMRITSAGNVGIGNSSPTNATNAPTLNVGTNRGTLYVGVNNIYDDGSFMNINGVRPIVFLTSSTERMRLDSSGNLGLGVTPSAWSGFKALQISRGSFTSFTTTTYLSHNWYYDGAGDKYIATDFATRYLQETGKHIWYTAPSGTAGNAITFTQAMTLDASGNLLVGTTSPSITGRISVAGNYYGLGEVASYDSSRQLIRMRMDSSVARLEATFFSGAGGGYVPLAFSTSDTERMRIDSAGNLGLGETNPNEAMVIKRGAGVAAVTAYRGNGTTSTGEFFVGHGSDAIAYVYNRSNQPLVFATNNTERMRIDSSGAVLMGKTVTDDSTTGFAYRSAGYISVARNNDSPCYFNRTGTDGAVVQIANDSSTVGTISVSGSTTSYNTSSDYRLKENIAPMTGALARVSALKPVTYKWKVDGSDGEGFIAHELQEIVPDCVTGGKDAVDAKGNPQYQGIDTSFLVATLTAAIQELKAEVDALKLQINQ